MKVTYKEIKSDILSKIVKGEWAPGVLVPNEEDLAEIYQCARATVNRAMRELASEGIIERRRKAGTRVRMTPLRQASFDIPKIRDEIESKGATYRYYLAKRSVEVAPDWLSARLELPQGGKVLHLICMHYADGTPYQYEDRWINLSALPAAEDTDFSKIGPGEWLLSTIPFSEAEINLSAGLAEKNVADYLGCAVGDPMFIIERSTRWQEDAVTYVRFSYRPGYRLTTRY